MEIKFDNVSYTYNENLPISKIALKGINLNFGEQKIYGVIGPVGSGKTTLIEHINALLLPTEGTVKVGNYTLRKNMKIYNVNELRSNVGLIFQFPEEQFFLPTVKEEIEFGLKCFKYKLNTINKRVIDALELVGLPEEILSMNPFMLSSGEKRKVAIASILVFNPKVVILDEPTVGLDYHGKKKLIALIKKLKERYKKTVIICSHDIDMLYQLVDNFIVLNKGEVITSGDKHDVFKHVQLLKDNNIKIPNIVEFTYKVINDKGVKLGKNMDIKELIKDIYRNV